MRFIRCNDVYYRGDKCTVSRETVEEIVCYNAVIKRYHWFHYIKKKREREIARIIVSTKYTKRIRGGALENLETTCNKEVGQIRRR